MFLNVIIILFMLSLITACGGSNGSSATASSSSSSSSSSGNNSTSGSSSSSSSSGIVDTASNRSFPTGYQINGNLFAVGNQDGAIKTWSAGTNKESILKIDGNSHWINALAFSPDGFTLATGGRDNKVHIWKNSSELQISLTGHTNWIYSLAFHPTNSNVLVSAGADQLIRTWLLDLTAKTGILSTSNQHHTGTIYTIAYASDGSLLASAGLDGKIYFWNSNTNTDILNSIPLATINGHDSAIYSLAFTHLVENDGATILASAGEDGVIKLWKVMTKVPSNSTLIEQLQGHTGAIYSLDFSTDNTQLISGGADKNVYIWVISTVLSAIKTNVLAVKTLSDPTGIIHSVSFSPDNQHILSSSFDDKKIKQWNVATGQKEKEFSASGIDSQGTLTPSATSVTLAKFAFQGMLPILNVDTVLTHPKKFSQLLTMGIFTGTADCPTTGKFDYAFTDINSDKKYDTKNDEFESITRDCLADGVLSNGKYILKLNQTITSTITDSHLTLNKLTIAKNNEKNTLEGQINITENDTGTKKTTTLNASTLKLDKLESTGDSNTLLFTHLTASVLDDYTITNEKIIKFNATIDVVGTDAGNYDIKTIQDFLLSPLDKYPYQGEMSITANSGIYKGIVSTIIVKNANIVLLKTDVNNDGKSDDEQELSWQDLSTEFN